MHFYALSFLAAAVWQGSKAPNQVIPRSTYVSEQRFNAWRA